MLLLVASVLHPSPCPADPTTEPSPISSTAPSTSPSTAASNQPPTLDQLKADDAAKTIANWALLPKVPSRSIKDVVHFFIANGNLALDTKLTGQSIPESQITFTDLPGANTIFVQPVRFPVAQPPSC